MMAERGQAERHTSFPLRLRVIEPLGRCVAVGRPLRDEEDQDPDARQRRRSVNVRITHEVSGPCGYSCSDSPEQVRRAVDNGNSWLEGVTKTLERLDQLCAKK